MHDLLGFIGILGSRILGIQKVENRRTFFLKYPKDLRIIVIKKKKCATRSTKLTFLVYKFKF